MLSLQQKSALEKLLLIGDNSQETIYSIVGRMEELGIFLRENPEYKNFLPFHETYSFVTKKIADTYVANPHYFQSRTDSEKLDIAFASLYFKPLLSYLTKQELHTPWQTFFEYCEQPHGVAFVQMLLGINAHINTDLVSALKETKYHQEKDFKQINDILLFEMPSVMKYLAYADHDFFAIAGMTVLRKFMLEEFQTIIVRWRKNAWNHYCVNTNIHDLALATESLGGEIIATFDHLIGEKSIKGVTQELNSLTITL